MAKSPTGNLPGKRNEPLSNLNNDKDSILLAAHEENATSDYYFRLQAKDTGFTRSILMILYLVFSIR